MVSLGRHFVPNPVLSDSIPRGPTYRIPFSIHTRYDPWNRLVRVADGADSVAEFDYDGLARRILLRSYVGGSLAETRHLYYTEPSRWQVLEERLESGGQPAATPDRQFVWGLRYIDDLLLRDRDTNSNGTLNERLYALQDANWNVTAVTDETGAIQERYAYAAYGTPLFLSPAFTPRASSQYHFTTLYTGREYDAPTGLYYYRMRYYQPGLGVFVGRDPIGYHDSTSLYQYALTNPVRFFDPSGNSAILAGCGVGFAGGAFGGAFGNLVLLGRGNIREWCCVALASGAGGCVQGGILGAVVDTGTPFLITAAGCIGGALGSLVAAAIEANVCGTRGPMEACDFFMALLNGVIGCIGGYAYDLNDFEALFLALGMNVGVWSSMCGQGGAPNVAMGHACCTFSGGFWGYSRWSQTVRCDIGRSPFACCMEAAKGTLSTWLVQTATAGKCGTR